MIGLTCKEPFLRSGIPCRSLITPWPHKHRIGGFDQFIATVDADLHFFLIGFKRGIVDFEIILVSSLKNSSSRS